MLVIARKVGEALRIGEHITIVVQQIRGKRVRLSVSAPDTVTITRTELDEEEQAHPDFEERLVVAAGKPGDPNGSGT